MRKRFLFLSLLLLCLFTACEDESNSLLNRSGANSGESSIFRYSFADCEKLRLKALNSRLKDFDQDKYDKLKANKMAPACVEVKNQLKCLGEVFCE